MDLTQLLYDLDNSLGQEDFESLKFLCAERIPHKKLDKMKCCLDVFEALEKSGDLNDDDQSILKELLFIIGQHNLLKLLNTNKTVMQEALRTEQYVSMYRRLLFDLSESITKDDLRTITFLIKIPNRFKENKTFLEILSHMDKSSMISQDNLDVLENVISKVSQELCRKIATYKTNREFQESQQPSVPIHSTHESLDPPFSIQAVSSTDPEFKDDDEMESIREHINQVQEFPNEKDVEAENYMSTLSIQNPVQSEVYPMNRKHRGYCLVINNSTFSRNKPRPGTEKDAEFLKRVFTWLGFDVVEHKEQGAQQIRDIMKEFQNKDHTDRDCFVCCILTHGESKAIFGTDSETVTINGIVSYFSSKDCTTLAGKPKLFFIQACQGTKAQPAYFIEEDAVSPKTIPDDADVLIGMSTVDGCFSYRHIAMGTWYIQALCSNLIKMVPKGEDILSILTNVNREVSEMEHRDKGMVCKQMPQPSYTLRMKLVFPIPSTNIK